jgi:hypothetical protein
MHIVSAQAAENWLVFGQVKTEEKSNEITAIPALLEKPALEGCLVLTRWGVNTRQPARKNQDLPSAETLYEDV